MHKADQGGTAQPSLRQRFQRACNQQECIRLIRELLKLPGDQLKAQFGGDSTMASACACTLRRAIYGLADLKQWLILLGRLRVRDALLPTPELVTAVEKLQKKVGLAHSAGQLLRDLHR